VFALHGGAAADFLSVLYYTHFRTKIFFTVRIYQLRTGRDYLSDLSSSVDLIYNYETKLYTNTFAFHLDLSQQLFAWG
jgi:hypothetical protein